MSTFRPYFSPYIIEQLNIKLSEKLGYRISNKPDCAKLSDLLLQNGYGYLSEATLYRLFFQSSKHSPYKKTLDILCQFIDFKNSEDFLESVNSDTQLLALNGINTEDESGNTLIFYCMENKNYHPLHHFFDSISDGSNLFKTSVGVSLFDSLRKLKDPLFFFDHFSSNTYIREYLLEKLHDPQFRIFNYEKAYLKYLEKTANHENGTGFQDYVFGNSILFRYYYLNNHGEEALKLGKRIYGEFATLEPYIHDIFIFPFIRFTAYKLWFLKISDAHQIQLDDYAFYLLDLCLRLKPKCDFESRQILFHTVAEAFLRCPEIHSSFHWDLKDIFADDFKNIPDLVFSKHLKYSLPYFDNNGLHNYRP